MIRYNLKCSREHSFEGWFRNSDDFDHQKLKGFIKCPECGARKIEKALMSPSVVTSPVRRRKNVPADADAKSDVAMAQLPSMPVELRERFLSEMRTLRRKVEENSEYVGSEFAEEARRIHHKESEERNIWGEASLDQARSLVEDGIEVMPLPRLPEDEN